MHVNVTSMNLEEALLGNEKMSNSWSLEEKRKKNIKALMQISLHLLNDILQNVLRKKIVNTSWLKLEQLCVKKSLLRRLHLKQRF